MAFSGCDDETVLDAIPVKDASADSASEAGKVSEEAAARDGGADRDDVGAEATASDASDEQPE
jgi:hypothetical protein